MIHFSVLDLSPVVQGGDAALSFRNTLDLAQHAERWGYRRYWLAEHHGMPGQGLKVPIWILGSSLFGAELAAVLGLPYAFASHFAPQQMMQAVALVPGQLPTIGAPGTVRASLNAFIERTGADELMITSQIFDHAARLRSYEITSGIFSE